MKKRHNKTTPHAPRILRERELQKIKGGDGGGSETQRLMEYTDVSAKSTPP